VDFGNVEIETASLRRGGEATIVTVLGGLDPSIREKLDWIAEDRHNAIGGPVIFDLAGSSVGDAGLRQVVEIADMAANGRSVAIVAPHGSVIAHLLMVRGVEPRLRVFETCDGALASLDTEPDG
jgi:hypothetical protein